MAVKGYCVAVAGATGAVGLEMIKTLEQRNFPVEKIILLASERSKGKKLKFKGKEYEVEVLSKDSFEGVDIALFSAGASRSIEFAPIAVKSGAVVVDNSSAFRMKKDVPLVVPEVNAYALKEHKGIIANPNCSTIQLVVVLKPIHKVASIKRVVISTYQAVSGAGQSAIDELRVQSKNILEGRETDNNAFPYRIAFNAIPQIDVFLENDYTKEEMKMINETKKILDDESIKVTTTAVRIPVVRGHAESVNLELEKELSVEACKKLLSESLGIKVVDNPKELSYPMPIDSDGRDEVFVGRIRQDATVTYGLNLWVVSDNLRKGAALNAVQIAEQLVALDLV